MVRYPLAIYDEVNEIRSLKYNMSAFYPEDVEMYIRMLTTLYNLDLVKDKMWFECEI